MISSENLEAIINVQVFDGGSNIPFTGGHCFFDSVQLRYIKEMAIEIEKCRNTKGNDEVRIVMNEHILSLKEEITFLRGKI